MDNPENRPSQQTFNGAGLFLIRRPWIPFLFFGGLFVLWAAIAHWPGPITAIDQEQPWLNTALPPPTEEVQIRFKFTPAHDGLRQLELNIARYGSEGEGSRLDFQLHDAEGQQIAAESWQPFAQDNQPYTLHFPPQDSSSGQSYTLIIGGSAGNRYAPWGYDLDVSSQSEVEVVGQESAARELRFTTTYELSPGAAVVELGRLVGKNVGLMILATLFIALPGCLAVLAGWRRTSHWDPAAWLGAALALGTASWPLIWLWFSTMGIGWAGWSLWAFFITGYAVVIMLVLWRTGWRLQSDRITRIEAAPLMRSFQKKHLWLVAILVVGLSVRLLAVRDQAFPPWVDSSRHALITAVMAENGRAISDYAPLLPVDDFPYHFGFHTLSTSLWMMTGLPLQQLLLVLGQLLNALVALAVYAGAYLLTRRWRASMLAAFLVSLPFLFPGYYATWGRMTQLAAMLVLPLALALTWWLVRGVRRWQPSWWLLAILVAGLFLTHFRVFLLYLPFAALTWLLSRGRNGRWLALAALASALAALPRILQLLAMGRTAGTGGSVPDYNEFPVGYLNTGWEKVFLVMLGIALLILIGVFLRSRRWSWLPLCLVAWTAVAAIVLAGRRIGLPETALINLNSAYISFFLPLALVLSIVFERLVVWVSQLRWSTDLVVWGVSGALIAAAALFGIHQQIDILNPQTILAYPEDQPGLDWIGENLGEDSLVAVNSWQWLGSTWTGSDGGAWILPLTGRSSTTPPADYIYNRDLAREVNSFNETASQVEDWSLQEQTEWLIEQGVTHIFVGKRGGFFDPSELSRNPDIALLYQEGGTFLFSLR